MKVSGVGGRSAETDSGRRSRPLSETLSETDEFDKDYDKVCDFHSKSMAVGGGPPPKGWTPNALIKARARRGRSAGPGCWCRRRLRRSSWWPEYRALDSASC